MDIHAYWQAVLRQDRETLVSFFREDAWVNWHCTNEHFTVQEFIQANCEYPGQWDGTLEQVMELGDQIITVTHVYNKAGTLSCHAVSFFRIREGRIQSVEEYWGDDGQPPRWRQEMGIGVPVREK